MVHHIIGAIHSIYRLAMADNVLVGVDFYKQTMFTSNEATFDVCNFKV